MSCQEEDKRSALLTHVHKHVSFSCPVCQGKLQCLDGALPFGNAMMTTWICTECATEKVVVVQEDGALLEASASPDLGKSGSL